MRKLNRKGFTLVELLAVIIILAIVVGITIPTINNIINDSKNSALETVLDSAENYLNDQYAFMNVDYDTASSEFKGVFTGPTTTDVTLDFTNNAALLKEMGLKQKNINSVAVSIDASGIACVKVVSMPTTSEYFVNKFWTVDEDEATPKATGTDVAKYKSKSCK